MKNWVRKFFNSDPPKPEKVDVMDAILHLHCEISDLYKLIDIQVEYMRALEPKPIPWDGTVPKENRQIQVYMENVAEYQARLLFNYNLIDLLKILNP